MSKKLLKESQVRRFMGLAGMRAHTVSNYLKESPQMYEQDDEDLEGDARAMGDLEGGDEMADLEGGDEMADLEGDAPPMGDLEGGEEASADVDPDAIKDLRQKFEDVMAPLEAALPGGGEEMGGEFEEPMGGEELPPADLEGDEALDDLDAEGGVDVEPTEDEVVQEVARRVAKRILTAKRAQDKMHEALGRRKPTRRAAKPKMRRRRTAPKRTTRRKK